MATVSVSVKTDKKALERLIRQSPAQARAVAQERAQALRMDVQRRMPKRTGATARQTREVQRGPYDWAVEIPEVPGRFLIEGTRAHWIKPKRQGGVLRFTVGGVVVFARKVWHPGTKANPFAEDAARAALRPLTSAVLGIFKFW